MGFDWNDKIILVTGGTGSFGRAFVRRLLSDYRPKTIRIYSRDELKQYQMQQEFDDSRLRFFIGDVRDVNRLIKATRHADVIVHAAAMKHVPICEYNPFEAIKTNIMGAMNVVDAALANNVPKVVALSTDKAVNPVNLYGATKLCSDKIFIHSNVYSGDRPTRFSCVRYGNVMASRGSVIPLFLKQREQGCVTITDPRMTRFWLSLDESVDLVTRAVSMMKGGEIFIPRIPSMKITDLAQALAPGCEQKVVGIRPGEKLHEVLINEDEGRYTFKFDDIFIVYPNGGPKKGSPVPENFMYASNTNSHWLTIEELRSLLQLEGSL